MRKEVKPEIGTKVRFAVFEGKVIDIEHGAIVARKNQYAKEILCVKYHHPVYVVRRNRIIPVGGKKPSSQHSDTRPPTFSKQRKIVRMFADEFQIQN